MYQSTVTFTPAEKGKVQFWKASTRCISTSRGHCCFHKTRAFSGLAVGCCYFPVLVAFESFCRPALMRPPFNPREFETWGMLLTTFISSFKKSNSNNKILPAVYHCCSCLSLFIVKGLLGRAVDSPAHQSGSLPQWRTLLGSCMWSTPNREDNLTAFWDISSLTSETWLSDFSYAFSS